MTLLLFPPSFSFSLPPSPHLLHSAAQSVGRLQQHDVREDTPKLPCGGQAGHAGADDGDGDGGGVNDGHLGRAEGEAQGGVQGGGGGRNAGQPSNAAATGCHTPSRSASCDGLVWHRAIQRRQRARSGED